METLVKDIRFGLRGLTKSPGFTVVATLLGLVAFVACYIPALRSRASIRSRR